MTTGLMNLDDIVAIDIHTHAEKSCRMPLDEEAKAMEEAKAKYFKLALGQPSIPEIADYYRRRKMVCVIFP
ncbi:4-hydroxyphenyl-beta-ketoacyl-CoA hydrolase, partial [bacterium]|nr:4-hydroxyphenyl-beta-ketoacyl-CoA hydrolase [bacterium]